MILITGGSGFIGRYLIKKLEVSYKIKIYDINKPAFETSAEFKQGDVTDSNLINEAARGCDTIIHLAAIHHDNILNEEEFYRVNVGAANNIIEAASIHNIKNIIFYSTVAVYGDTFSNVAENTQLNPTSPYGRSKLEAENIFIKWTKGRTDRKLYIIRPAVVIGPYNYANMFKLIEQIDKGLYLHIGSGKNIKSIAYVENVVDATIFILENIDEQINIFNYADEPQLTSRQIANIIKDILTKKKTLKIPYFVAFTAGFCFDVLSILLRKDLAISSKRIRKFCSETFVSADKIRQCGFKPVHTSIDGISKMAEWYKRFKHKGVPPL
jgi:nucleoside-diphosphate-sugar epimerase